MSIRAAFLLLPVVLLAQTPNLPQASADVDQALRARVTEFVKFNADGNYRKAYDMVAEDSKDFYFAAAKTKYLTFKIEGIEYSDDFKKAVIKATTKQSVSIPGQTFELALPISDTWKIEDRKWMWYHQETGRISTPLGEVQMDPAKKGDDSASPLPIPKNITPDAVAAAAQQLASGTSVDKSSIEFSRGKAAADEVIFHNGAAGVVQLEVEMIGDASGLKVDPQLSTLAAGHDVTVKVSYDPAKKSGSSGATVRLTVQPFGKEYLIPITFTNPAPNQR